MIKVIHEAKKNPPIVLLTDYGVKDAYSGVLKGVIYSICSQANIVDLSHEIGAQDIAHGACVLKSAYSFFPSGSLFVCVVDPGVGTSRQLICAKTRRHYFLGPDNGLLAPVLEIEKPQAVRVLENPAYYLPQLSNTFHGRDILAPVAAYLAVEGATVFERLGPKLLKWQSCEDLQVEKSKKRIKGEILYFDHFGNAITNIQVSDAKNEMWKKAKIKIKGKSIPLKENYSGGNNLCAIFNSFSHLEIAWSCGSAREKAKLQTGESIEVFFA